MPKFTKLNTGWNADPNVPFPSVALSGDSLLLRFRLNHFKYHRFAEDDIGILRFLRCAKYRLGDTNDEGWYMGQCRYSKIAPAWGEFYEISGPDEQADANDDWIRVFGSNAVTRHFLFYFRDETFECFADDWCVEPGPENALHEIPLMRDSDLEQRLDAILRHAPLRMQVFEIVRSLALPDGAVGAGFIRAAVWDTLSGYTTASPVDDIDVLYFDPENRDPWQDEAIEQKLRDIDPALPWSVRNQARMHIRNGDAPYGSTADALRFWLETPTCVAVRLGADGRLEILAPYGLQDLFSMSIRPTSRGHARKAEYTARIAEKKWHERWPNVTVELP